MIKDEEILLFSGGMDSFIAWFYLKKPACLFVDLGQRYAEYEEETVDMFAEKYGMKVRKIQAKSIGLLFEEDDAHIPMRNLFLATLGGMFSNVVHVVCQEGERSIPDRSEEFFCAATDALSVADGKPKAVSPVFWEMTKVEIVAWYKKEGYPTTDLIKTFSCFNTSTGQPCAACSACFRRAQAFLLNGIREPWYSRLERWDGLNGYCERLEAGHYQGKRAEEMKRALDLLGNG